MQSAGQPALCFSLLHQIQYLFNTTTVGKPNRVVKVSEYDGAKLGSELNIEYAHNQTTFTDHKGNRQILQFNNLGNTVSIQDGEGRAQFAQYATNEPSSTVKGNQLTLSSKMQNTVGNRLSNSSFETYDVWKGLDSNVTVLWASEAIYFGANILYMARNCPGEPSGAVSPAFTVEPGATYTFSAYVRVKKGAAYLELHDGTGAVRTEDLEASQEWTRLQLSYTNTGNTEKSVTARLMMETAGVVYLDGAQVEKAPTASRYNLAQNGDFRDDSAWFSHFISMDDYTTVPESAAPQLDNRVFQFEGNPDAQQRITQDIRFDGVAGDTFILTAYHKSIKSCFRLSLSKTGLFSESLVFC